MKQKSLYLFLILLLLGTHENMAASKNKAKDNFLKDNIAYAAKQTQNMLNTVGEKDSWQPLPFTTGLRASFPAYYGICTS